MPESTLSTSIVRALNALPRCHAEKRWTGGFFTRAGEPDVTGCYRGQRFEIEVKIPGKRPRKVQEKRLREWEESGAITGVATSVAEAIAILTNHPEDIVAARYGS